MVTARPSFHIAFDGREDAVQPGRLLLVDQNDDFLDGLCSLVEKDPGLKVVGRAHSAAEAIERTQALHPDLVLMDVALHDKSGFQVVPWLKGLRPAPRVLLMTFHSSRVVEAAGVGVGADGCISKTDVPDVLLFTIQDLLWPDSPLALATRTG
jgi:DNA-binding NarL/FixJ family response regulator